jgi:exocyst complex component 8
MENGVLALNAATYKVTHAVRFVLLDDAVLVARRKKGRDGGGSDGKGGDRGGRWVAERCWLLNEMLVLDTKDSACERVSAWSGWLELMDFCPAMTNVFKIRHGKETHVYRTEVASDKKSLLSQFRHIADELATKRRKEREGEHERRKTMWGGADVGQPLL